MEQMRGLVFLFLSCVLLAPVADAATVAKKSIRGSLIADDHSAYNLAAHASETNWTTIGIGVGVVALVAGAAAFFVLRKKPEDPEKKVDAIPGEDEVPTLAPDVERKPAEPTGDSRATDVGSMVQLLAQKVAQDVGPKLSKGGAVRNVLNARMDSFTHNTKNFVLNELNATAGALLKELGAEEAMLLLDWNTAVESNFPPMSILLAGVMSPTVLGLMSFHHFLQAVTVGLPTFCLCIAAVYIDWDSVCSIPTIHEWLYTTMLLGFLMFVGHMIMLWSIKSGQGKLDAKSKEVSDKIAKTKEGTVDNMREQVVGNLCLLQEALLIENGIRHSVWNMIVGVATIAWIFTTFWNLVLIIRWTFVPGVTAFHPKAADVAAGDYCGSWMTVLVLRISMLLSVLYLFFNVATVVQFVCDMMINNQGFSQAVLGQARDMDKNGMGLPVIEVLAKAFLLRGGADTLNSRMAVVGYQKASLESEKAALEKKLKDLDTQIDGAAKEESKLKEQIGEASGGDLAAQCDKMQATGSKLTALQAEWKESGKDMVEQAEEKAKEIQEATAEALEELWEKIQEEIEYVKNTEAFKVMEQKVHLAYDKLCDPAFHQELKDMASHATEQAKDLALQAKDMVTDPALIEKANQAMERAKQAAAELEKAVTDPELRAKLEEAAKQAFEEAQREAHKVAEAVNDPEMQQKLKDASQQALAKVEQVRESSVAVANDPELRKKLADIGTA